MSDIGENIESAIRAAVEKHFEDQDPVWPRSRRGNGDDLQPQQPKLSMTSRDRRKQKGQSIMRGASGGLRAE